jgi:hypothetical protein
LGEAEERRNVKSEGKPEKKKEREGEGRRVEGGWKD